MSKSNMSKTGNYTTLCIECITSARRRPIRFSEVASISTASGGDSIFNLCSCSTRKLTLHSSSRLRRISHSCSNFLLAASIRSIFILSFSSLVYREEHQHDPLFCIKGGINETKVTEDESRTYATFFFFG